MSNIGKKVFIAMSGGVDSSVAAALLKNDGYDVTGVHMICAGPPSANFGGGGGCESGADRRDAMKVAAVLSIPFLTWDFRDEYKKDVYDYMISEYMNGRTPNPDVMCNKQIKFGVFLKKALENGADFIATGHYVSAKQHIFSQYVVSLHTAKDKNKDQSYFLWTLTQDQLKHCLFPIGNYLKPEVRGLAKKFKLPTSGKKDSQGLCFVGKVDFLDFLKEKIPACAGDVLDFSGKKIGTHEGAHFYTIGQRHGVFSSTKHEARSTKPMYVAEKNVDTNMVVMVDEEHPALYKKEVEIRKINWISGKEPEMPASFFARIRYRQSLQKTKIYGLSTMDYGLIFENPQRAVASGQSVVFYNYEGEMLGGGIIA